MSSSETGNVDQIDLAATSVDDLLKPENSLSVLQQRLFAGRTETDITTTASEEIEAAKAVLPVVQSAYVPSGRTTFLAVASMLLACPILLVILLVVCGGLCIGYELLGEKIVAAGGNKGPQLLGLLGIVLDFLIMFLLCWIPTVVFGGLSRLFKNRNPTIAAVLVGLTTLLAAVLLFAPLFGGQSVAPSDITFLFIPMKWVIILVGGLLSPLFAAIAVSTKISGQKFCEVEKVYLKPTTYFIPFDFAENALELLRRNELVAVARLPRATEKKPKHAVRITAWSHERASTSFLELEACYSVREPKGNQPAEAKTESWLFFSQRMDTSAARSDHSTPYQSDEPPRHPSTES